MNKIDKWFDKINHYNFKNKTFLATGSTSGIGLEFSKFILDKGSKLIMGVRNIEKANKIRNQLLNINPNYHIDIICLDLSDLDSIDNFISYIIKNNIDIDCFYNNAGIFRSNISKTKQGYDYVIGTNYIGTYYLSIKILDYLKSLNHNVDYILTGSVMGLIYNYDKNNIFKSSNDAFKNYGISKRLIFNLFEYLKNNYSNSNIKISIVHPGATYTPLVEHMFKSIFLKIVAKNFMKIFLNPLDVAILGTIYALNNESGFYGPNKLFKLKGFPNKIKLSNRITRNYKYIIDQTMLLLDRNNK